MMSYLELLADIAPALWSGLQLTALLTVASLTIGLVIGLLIAILRTSERKFVRFWAHVYIDGVRGTPLLVQLFLVYYGLPQLGLNLPPIAAAIATLGLHYGAYLAEVFRGGLVAVDPGQWEAATVLNFRRGQMLRYIVLPQAIRVALPGIGNYANSMVKDTSLASVVTVAELLRQGQIEVAATFRSFEIYLTVAVLYLMISLPLAWATKRLEVWSSAYAKR